MLPACSGDRYCRFRTYTGYGFPYPHTGSLHHSLHARQLLSYFRFPCFSGQSGCSDRLDCQKAVSSVH